MELADMLKKNDETQAQYRAKAILCDHALQTFNACKHYKNIDKKMETKHKKDFIDEYLRLETEYSAKVTIYSRALGYNEQIGFYIDADGWTWDALIAKAQKAKEDFMRYITELEREKDLYPAAIEREEKIKALQDEARQEDAHGKMSYVGQKFFPRSFCSDCHYSNPDKA